jgi:hypothetical protein
MIRFLRDFPDLGAASVLYNLACIPLCRSELVDNRIHIKVLEFMTICHEPTLKSAFLQILVQLSGSNVCIVDLLKMDLIHKLESQLKFVTGKNDVWRDVSLMLLAVVAYTAHDLTEHDQISILHILKQICVKGVEEDIIENCANVLKFISTRFNEFQELDPVVRAILELGDSEEIIDNVSTILYNMTCNKNNLHSMLKDAQYVNVMIRIMRNGKVNIQENIAYAIRTLCAIDKCTELLLRYDILSDLIVIALLRTSSEEIKIVCSQAFYNMLCHEKTRLDLLKGDLWWALMRLGRTDSQTVRSICIRALSDLSYPLDASFFLPTKTLNEDELQKLKLHRSCILALRKHHVLSFMKDLSLASNPDVIPQCLEVVHNLLKQFILYQDAESGSNDGSSSQYGTHEVIASIRIAADALHRSTDIKCVRIATILLLKCSQLTFNTATSSNSASIEANPSNALIDNEFVNIDIVEVLRLSINNWKYHNECRLNISRLLYELSKRKFFPKLVLLNDLNPIFTAIYPVTTTSTVGLKQQSKDALANANNHLEILENILGVILQFILTENIKAMEVVQLTLWPLVLRDALSSSSSLASLQVNSILHMRTGSFSSSSSSAIGLVAPPTNSGPPVASLPQINKSRMSVYQRESSMASIDNLENLRGNGPGSFRTQGMALMVFAYCVDDMLVLLQKHYQKNSHVSGSSKESGNYHAQSAAGATSTVEQTVTDQPSDANNTNDLVVISVEGDGEAEVSFTVSGEEAETAAKSTKQKQSRYLNNTDEKSIIESLLSINYSQLIQGVMKNDFIDYQFTRNNLLHIVHSVSQYHTPVIEALYFPDAFTLLSRVLSTSVGTVRHEKMQEYCSCLLRNISVNHHYLAAFIQIPYFQVINELIKELCDFALQNLTIAMDMSIFFYFLSDYLQSPTYIQQANNQSTSNEDKILSPKFVLDMINKLLSHQMLSNPGNGNFSANASTNSSVSNGNNAANSNSVAQQLLAAALASVSNSLNVNQTGNLQTPPSLETLNLTPEALYQSYVNTYYEMININKYTISILLNKYSFAHGVDPSFVQNMYSYLQTNSLVLIPNLMKDVKFKKLGDMKFTLYQEYLTVKEIPSAELLLFYYHNTTGASHYFQPIIINSYQENNHIILKLTNSKSVLFDKLEMMDTLTVQVFQKIIHVYDAITEQQFDLHNVISEENDEDDDKSIHDLLPGETDGRSGAVINRNQLPEELEADDVNDKGMNVIHEEDDETLTTVSHQDGMSIKSNKSTHSQASSQLGSGFSNKNSGKAANDINRSGSNNQLPALARSNSNQRSNTSLKSNNSSSKNLSVRSNYEKDDILTPIKSLTVNATTSVAGTKSSDDEYSMNSFEES